MSSGDATQSSNQKTDDGDWRVEVGGGAHGGGEVKINDHVRGRQGGGQCY